MNIPLEGRTGNRNLLVVDFDYFFRAIERVEESRFPQEWSFYDWGHSEEDSVFHTAIWPDRASGFLRVNRPLPMCDEEALATFWSRFKFARHTQLFYADSNMHAFYERVRQNIREVWLYDAHHDCGYRPDAIERLLTTKQVTCENWMLAYAATDVALHMRYPEWRSYALEMEPEPLVPLDRQVDDGSTPDVVFDRVFLCKSPAWVPAWCDDQWVEFLRRAPFRRKTPLDGAVRRRDFDIEAAMRYAEAMRMALAEMVAQKAREGAAQP